MSASVNVKTIVEKVLEPLLESEGYELWNVEYKKEGKSRELRVFVDKDGGINLEDCENVSRFLSEKLDESDPISEEYSLIVSSPGMDRQLIVDEHYKRYLGTPVEVSLYKGVDGRKKFCALLGEKNSDELKLTPIDKFTLEPEGDAITIPTELISKVNLMVII